MSVHALTYGLMISLPAATSTVLGLLAGNPAAVSEFERSRPTTPYFEHLLNVVQGDLGLTINRAPVTNEVLNALQSSSVTVFLSLAISLLLVVGLARFSAFAEHGRLIQYFDFLNLIPPFIVPFAAAAVLFATPLAGSDPAVYFVLYASIVLPTFFMLFSTLLRLRLEEDNRPYNRVLASNGVDPKVLRAVANSSATFILCGILDRAVVIALVCLLLAETVLGVQGLGTLTARAVRTSDINLTIGVTLTSALIVVLTGVMATWIQHAYAAWVGRSA
ncbi:hypothetical protein [Parvibaculum sp.]|uniref:hypothetical protein n=1 Tax=Parvibaculum sp. TaxID=2024848 RepID=UPI00262588CF|nr:hypothetical protein [Parvibaculum sp.]MCW5726221.1 hypothetical protein [Parvibaculum sp.]